MEENEKWKPHPTRANIFFNQETRLLTGGRWKVFHNSSSIGFLSTSPRQ